MNRFLLLLLIAGIVFLVVFFAARPDMVENIWLWLVGLSGAIVKIFQSLIEYFKKKFVDGNDKNPTNDALVIETEKKPTGFNGSTLTLYRYTDDGDTTLGLLSVNGSFYCYTLEDAFHNPKIAGKTRIPAGTYPISFGKENTPLTLKYQERYPEWFTFHLELKNVPGFASIYIHNGGDHTDTEGCILVSDALSAGNEKQILTNSRNTFKRLYEFLGQKISEGVPIGIIVKDEKWLKA
jgi:Family of unknown function (DUF5675)